jgi:hypothetical protein
MAELATRFEGGFFDTSSFLSNAEQIRGIINVVDRIAGDPGVASSEVTQTQTLPAGAIVLGATYTVTAKPAGFVTIGSVAQVRDAAGNALVVDFQGMRTVDRLRAPVAISQIKPWAGTKFADDSEVTNGASTEQAFTEIQTERLLVEFTGAIGTDDLASGGSATVLSPPADLELLVNGTRAWFNAGPAKPAGAADDPTAYQATVDLTAAIRAAVAAAPTAANEVDVEIMLRSSVPGQLALDAALELQRTFVVQFPEGPTRVVDAAEEGVYELLLPLPPESATWQVHEVQAIVSGTLGPPRVLPPDGPTLSPDAELRLDADHAVLVGLPPAGLAPLASLAAIRLPLGVGADGAELAGVLRADADGLPGEPLKDGQLGPVTLPAGDLDDRTWTTLPLAKEHKVAPGERLWVGLQLARGQVSWPLAVPGPSPSPPALPDDAPLRRQLPNGAFRPLSAAGDLSTTTGALRLVGEAPNGSPIPALALDAVLDATGDAVGVPPFTPVIDGVPVVLRLDPPITHATAPAVFDASGALKLRLTTKTPGSISFTGVRIAYTDGDGS